MKSATSQLDPITQPGNQVKENDLDDCRRLSTIVGDCQRPGNGDPCACLMDRIHFASHVIKCCEIFILV